MNCLHLCNDYLGSAVHTNLYRQLESLNVRQTVFVPYRKRRQAQKQAKEFFYTNNTEVVFSRMLKKYHRIFFTAKINYLYESLVTQLNVGKFDIINASTLYSDGYLAYKVSERYGIPYIVAVRSSDVDVFMKVRPDLKGILKKVLKNAKQIIFISKGLQDKFYKRIGDNEALRLKSRIIYNGLDESWLNNRVVEQSESVKKLLYVGSLIKRKNIYRTIKAVLQLNKRLPFSLTISIVGDGGHYSNKVRLYASKHPDIIKFYGMVKDKSELRSIYRKHDIFIMASYRETFGLVYVEALTQGLSLVISKGEGVDGMFDEVAIKVDPFSVKAIGNGILTALDRHDPKKIKNIDLSPFYWADIAKEYYTLLKLYQNEN